MTRLDAAVRELVEALRKELAASAPSARSERLLSVHEAAGLLGVGRTALYHEIGAGRVRSLRVGRRRLVPSSAIAESIIGAARVGLLVARDPDDDARRIVAVTRNDLAPEPPSLAFQLVPDAALGAARVEWLGESAHGASALLAIRTDDPEEGGALAEAVDVLRTILADGRWPRRLRSERRRRAQESPARPCSAPARLPASLPRRSAALAKAASSGSEEEPDDRRNPQTRAP